MGSSQPYMYDKPSTYTFGSPTSRPFNPKAVTHASWTPPAQKVKQDGPLVNFNRHPDSYVQAPYGKVNVQPMNPKTQGRVKLAWRSQRILRILALLAAVGAVFCIIAIRKTTTSVGWIIRVGPSVAVCHTLYAVYFLCRAVNSRPPTSCASYQMFASLLDIGLIPFFAFSGYMAWADYSSNAYGWGTLFDDNVLDYKVIEVFFIVCAVEIGLLCLSLVLDIYLAVTYRKIAKLPPDMNPLEDKDNLTVRPRHKRNKSELLHEKHLSNSTLASQRYSQQSQSTISGRRVPFTHTRTDSTDRDGFQKDFLDDMKVTYGVRASTSLNRDEPSLSRPSSAVTPASNARPAGAGLDHKPARSSNLARSMAPRPSSWLSYSIYEGMPAELSDYAEQELEANIRAMSPVSAMSEHENYNTHGTRHNLHSSVIQGRPQINVPIPSQANENDMPSPEDLSIALPPAYTPPKKRSLQPLGMNPPTPVDRRFEDKDLMVRPLSTSSYGTPPRHALQEADSNSIAFATPASRPSSFVGSGTKSRFYGVLRNSVGGSPTRAPQEEVDGLHRSDTVKTAESGNFEVYASDSDDDYDLYRLQHGRPLEVGELTPGHEWSGQRHTSNSTGFDLHNGYAGLDPDFGKGMARRRDVSGKAAEEGRGYEIAAANAMEAESRLGAAGWARFGGL